MRLAFCAFVMAAPGVVGCGSTVVLDGDNGTQGPGGTGSGGAPSGGSGGAGETSTSGTGGAGGCEGTEVLVDGSCLPAQIVDVELTQQSLGMGFAHARTRRWSETGDDEPSVVAESSDCWVLDYAVSTQEAGYVTTPLDVGNVSFEAEGKSLAMPSFDAGETSTSYGQIFDPDPAGGPEVTMVLSGGVDAGAATAVVAFPPMPTVSDVPPMNPGQPWTMTFGMVVPGNISVGMATAGRVLRCDLDGPTVTVDGSLTSALTQSTTATAAEGTAWLATTSQPTDTGTGVSLQFAVGRAKTFTVSIVP